MFQHRTLNVRPVSTENQFAYGIHFLGPQQFPFQQGGERLSRRLSLSMISQALDSPWTAIKATEYECVRTLT